MAKPKGPKKLYRVTWTIYVEAWSPGGAEATARVVFCSTVHSATDPVNIRVRRESP